MKKIAVVSALVFALSGLAVAAEKATPAKPATPAVVKKPICTKAQLKAKAKDCVKPRKHRRAKAKTHKKATPPKTS